MASNVQITNASASFQAVFALDIITAGVALLLLALATTPTFQRIRQRRFSVTSQDRPTPLKTTLGTYLFLWPALACLFIAYTCRFVGDLLGTSGNIQYDRGLQLHGRFPTSGGSYGYGPAVLSLASALAEIFFTVLLNGGVWIYSTHTMANGTGREAPGIMDKIYNAFIMLCILATGLASWGYGMSVRGRETTWASVIDDNNITRIIFVVYRCVVIAASLSVSAQVIKEYFETKANSRRDVSISPLHYLVSKVAPP